MSGSLTLDHTKSNLDELRTRVVYSLACAKADPNAAAFVPELEQQRKNVIAADAIEMDYADAIVIAQAQSVPAVRALNAATRAFILAINPDHTRIDRTTPIYDLFLGTDTESHFDRRGLKAKRDLMKPWPDRMTNSTLPAVQARSAPTASALAIADAAVKTLDDAEEAFATYRKGGARQKLFDDYNKIMATMHGALKAAATATPALGKPEVYAGSFSQRSATTVVAATETPADAAAAVASLEEQLVAAKAHHDELVAAAKKHADAVLAANTAVQEAEAAKILADKADVIAKGLVNAAKATEPKKKPAKSKGKPKPKKPKKP